MHLQKVIDNITISPRSNRLLKQLMNENPDNPYALTAYLEERLQRDDVVRYLKF